MIAVQSRLLSDKENPPSVTSTSTSIEQKSNTKTDNKAESDVEIDVESMPDSSSALDADAAQNKTKVLHACQHCSYSCKNLGDLKKHEKRHWTQKPYKCAYCNFDGVTRYDITSHLKRIHTDLEPKIEKVLISKKQTIIPIVRKRKYNRLSSDVSSSSDETAPKLIIVDASVSQKELKEEQNDANPLTNGIITNYVCPSCKLNINLIDLKRQRKKDGAAFFICNKCGYSIECNKIAEYSILPKLQPKPALLSIKDYACEYCDSEFDVRSELIDHHTLLHSHLELNILPELKREVRSGKIKTYKKKYKCGLCVYKTNYYKLIKVHIRQHSKPYKCSYCSQLFVYPSLADDHCLKHHPDVESSYEQIEEATKKIQNIWSATLVLNDDGQYVELRTLKGEKRVTSDSSSQPSKVRIVEDFDEFEDDFFESGKATARKSTTQLNTTAKPYKRSPYKKTARKSTASVSKVHFEGYSYYGNKPDLEGIENVMTTLTFNESQVPVTVVQLKNIFDIFPSVVVTDIVKNPL